MPASIVPAGMSFTYASLKSAACRNGPSKSSLFTAFRTPSAGCPSA